MDAVTNTVMPFSVVAKTNLVEIACKGTRWCFADPKYNRVGVFPGRLPLKQQRTGPCTIWTVVPAEKRITVDQWVARVLNVREDTPRTVQKQLLSSRGHFLTLAQVEAVESGGRHHAENLFFLVETADDDFSVYFLSRQKPHAGADTDTDIHGASHFLIRNLDASWLGV